jgi:Flp pilus assembly protein TadD
MLKNRQILPLLLLIALTGCNSSWKPKWLSRFRPQSENRKVADNRSEDSEEDSDEDVSSASSEDSPTEDSPTKDSPDNVSTVSQSSDAELADVERHARMIRNAQNALRQHRIEDASKIYRDVLNEAPEHPDAHHGLAMASDLDEDWGDAEYHYKQALRIRPRDAVILSDLGYSYILQNRFAEAARYLNQAIELQPNYERAHTNLALLDLKQGNRAAAEQRLVKRLGNSPQTTDILESLQQQAAESTAPAAATTPSAVANNPPAIAPTPQKSSAAPALDHQPAKQISQNMGLEEVQELARRERELAQQQRSERELLTSAPTAQEPQYIAPTAPFPAPAQPDPLLPHHATPAAPPAAPAIPNSPNPARLALSTQNSEEWPSANAPDPNITPDTLLLPQQPQPTWSSTASQAASRIALTPPVPIRSSSSGTTAGAESYGQPAGFNRSLPSRMRITENISSQPAPSPVSSYPQPLRTEGLNIGPGSLFPVLENSQPAAPATDSARNVRPVGYTQPAQFEQPIQPVPNQTRLSLPTAAPAAPANTATAQYPSAWPPASRTRSQPQPQPYSPSQP